MTTPRPQYLGVPLTPEERAEIDALAAAERRRPSVMGAVLIAEALEHRRNPPKPKTVYRRAPAPGADDE